MTGKFIPHVGCSQSVRHGSYAQTAMRKILDSQLDAIQDAGTWKDERVITTEQASEIAIAGRREKLLNFCSNNYLGLSVCTIYYCFYTIFSLNHRKTIIVLKLDMFRQNKIVKMGKLPALSKAKTGFTGFLGFFIMCDDLTYGRQYCHHHLQYV